MILSAITATYGYPQHFARTGNAAKGGGKWDRGRGFGMGIRYLKVYEGIYQ